MDMLAKIDNEMEAQNRNRSGSARRMRCRGAEAMAITHSWLLKWAMADDPPHARTPYLP